jgi:hypothetical protein
MVGGLASMVGQLLKLSLNRVGMGLSGSAIAGIEEELGYFVKVRE